MYTIFALGVTSFALCMLLTPVCRNVALRFGLVDQPDSDRKLHEGAIPRIGGVPIALAYAGSLAFVLFFTPGNERLHIRHLDLLWYLLPATGIIFLTGLLDDLIGFTPWQKLLGQLTGACVATLMGFSSTLSHSAFADHHSFWASPWVKMPLCILWLVICTNAVNLIDGLDGLASGVGLIATVTTLLAAVFGGNTGLILATIPLAGCLLAFLYYNFSPASIFLGDSGSLTIGFMLGCFALVWTEQDGSPLGMAGPLIALTLPLIDVGLAICRRFLRRVPIFKGDRGHIHHMVLARGYKPHQTALILYGVCAVAASLALLQSFSPIYLRAIAIVTFLVLVWAGVKHLDYVEIGAARRAFSRRRVLTQLYDEIYLHELGRSLSKEHSAEGCWKIVCEISEDMQFDRVEMLMDELHFQTAPADRVPEVAWNIKLPLGKGGYLSFSRTEYERSPKLMLSAIELLREELTKKATASAPLSIAFTGARKEVSFAKEKRGHVA